LDDSHPLSANAFCFLRFIFCVAEHAHINTAQTF
jgi:hypothetical protein